MKREPQIIPLDGAIKDFEKHLKNHPRTILSAKFGDGKSFFLTATEKKLSRKYVFLKIYPVNYQVAEDKDIFEYIKRDLLFQMYGKGLVPDTYEISDDIASILFLKKNWQSVAEEILNELSNFDASNTIKTALGAAKFLKAIKPKYDSFKENGDDTGEQLERFIAAFEKKGIYESDPITVILGDIFKKWKEKNRGKRVCLVFEDMDRIDPAHIFRILNVISAQIDYCYKYGVSPKYSSVQGNKFGVDNIVVCLDYDNLQKIFYHFYGKDVCFEGYINKFSDKGFFTFSLKEQTYQFYAHELVSISGMSSEMIKLLMDEYDFTSFTLRQFYHACDGAEKQVCFPNQVGSIVLHRGFYVIAAILYRLGLSRKTVIQVLASVLSSNPLISLQYLASTMIYKRGGGMSSRYIFSFGKKSHEDFIMYSVRVVRDDGVSDIEQSYYLGRSLDCIVNSEEEIEYMLQFVDR